MAWQNTDEVATRTWPDLVNAETHTTLSLAAGEVAEVERWVWQDDVLTTEPLPADFSDTWLKPAPKAKAASTTTPAAEPAAPETPKE